MSQSTRYSQNSRRNDLDWLLVAVVLVLIPFHGWLTLLFAISEN